MKNGIIVQKLAEMEDTLRRMRPFLPSSFEELSSDWGRQKILERVLQILVEAMIDTGERIVALSGSAPCETSAEVMQQLEELGVIQDAKCYVPMVRFRNFLVHQYDKIDLSIVYTLATRRLEDFERFIFEISAYVESA